MALATFLAATPAAGQDGGSLADQARAAARSDRNAEAADLFRRAIEAEPPRRAELLREYADQLTYSDRSRDAVPLFREVLARGDLPADERLRAQRGLALALSWSGALPEAVAAYSELLARDPNDVAALLGRARVQLSRRRYGAAAADYRAALTIAPDNAEARRGLGDSQALLGNQRDAATTLAPLAGRGEDAAALALFARSSNWLGRLNEADAAAARALELEPQNGTARSVRREVAIARSPLAEFAVRHSEQSNDLGITEASVAQTFFPDGALAAIGAGYTYFRFDPADGPTIDIHRPRASARLRLGDAVELNGEAGLNIEEEPNETDEILTYSVYATVQPSDRLRFDAGVNRQTFDNIRSLLLDITATNYSASVDIGSDAGLKAALRGSYSTFSDGNERTWGQVELRQRLLWQPNLFVGARYTRFSFDRLLDNGYFNPLELEQIEATAQLWGRTGDVYYDLRGSLGREDAEPGGAKFTYSAEGRLTWLATDRIQLDAFLNSFSSRVDVPGGFSRTTGGLAVRVRW